MIVKEFEEKYKDKGGIVKLTEMRSLAETQQSIAEHFGVSKERVRHWMYEFFGSQYDARSDRKQSIIEGMIDFGMINGLDEFNSAFKGISTYYKDALVRLIKERHDSKRL